MLAEEKTQTVIESSEANNTSILEHRQKISTFRFGKLIIEACHAPRNCRVLNGSKDWTSSRIGCRAMELAPFTHQANDTGSHNSNFRFITNWEGSTV